MQLEADKKVQQLSIRQKNMFNYLLMIGSADITCYIITGIQNLSAKTKTATATNQ